MEYIFPIFSFEILFTRYLTYAQGAFSPDSIDQLGQVISGKYNDHHPVLQTLFAFALPLKVTGKVEAIVIFQIIEFSGIFAYLAYTFLEFLLTEQYYFGIMVFYLQCRFYLPL